MLILRGWGKFYVFFQQKEEKGRVSNGLLGRDPGGSTFGKNHLMVETVFERVMIK